MNPFLFSIVISSVDAGTAKVVTQVIAEMAAASGVTVPPPGSPAAVSISGSICKGSVSNKCIFFNLKIWKKVLAPPWSPLSFIHIKLIFYT